MPHYTVTLGEREFVVDFDENGLCTVNGKPVSLLATGPHQYRASLGDTMVAVAAVGNGTQIELNVAGTVLHATVESERDRLLRTLAGGAASGPTRTEIHAPMPALIVKLEVAEGQSVHAGQGLLILEAMKMENEIRAPHEGTITTVSVAQGQAVEKGQLLLVLDEAGGSHR